MGGCVAAARSVDPTEMTSEAAPGPGTRPPKCVAFRSSAPNGKYLSYARQGNRAATERLLQLDGEDVTSPHTRFFMEPSKEHHGLLHVRCCYDNKYWAAKQLQTTTAGSSEPLPKRRKTCPKRRAPCLRPRSARVPRTISGACTYIVGSA